MKAAILVSLFALGASVSAQASQTLETLITCEQDHHGHWLEAGIVMNDGPDFELVVVEHGDGGYSAQLVHLAVVTKRKLAVGTDIYADSSQRAQLVVASDGMTKDLKASLTVLKDGGNSIHAEGLGCHRRGTITF